MSTEARIGVVAGLFIVVVTSVYFFYGQSSQVDDVLVSASGAKPVTSGIAQPPPPKIPPTALAPAPGPVANAARSRPPRTSPVSPGDAVAVSANAPTRPATPSHEPVASADRPAPPRFDASGSEATRGLPTGLESPRSTLPDDLAVTSWDRLARPGAGKPATPASNPLAAGTADRPASETARPVDLASSLQAARGEPSNRLERNAATAPPAARDAVQPPRPVGSSARPAEPQPKSAGEGWPRQHRIVSGDTLVGLAFAYYEDSARVDAIIAANPQIKNPRALKIGDVVNIPAPPGTQVSTPTDGLGVADRSATREARPTSGGNSQGAGLVTLAGRAPPSRPTAADDGQKGDAAASARRYVVQDGDTFYGIAAKMLGDGNKWPALFEANRVLVRGDPKRLQKGMTLIVPASGN